MRGVASRERSCQNSVLIRPVVVAVNLAERLSIGVAARADIYLQGRPALRSEQGRYGPATQQPAPQSALVSEKRRLIDNHQAVYEPYVERLRSVGRVEVPGVDHGYGARGLLQASRSQGAAPGEIGARRQATPVLRGEREEGGVVIA